MIENMRKYTGLMAVVIVLLAAGLVVTMNQTGSGHSGIGNGFMNVNGVGLDRNDFRKEGQNTVSAIQRLGQAQNFNDFFKLSDFARTLTGAANSESQSYINFVTNRILLKQGAEKLGLYSSPEAAAKYIEDNMFQGRDGAFDATMYQNYIDSLGNLGLKERDFQQLVAEYIVFTKTRDLIGGGLTPSASQTITADKLNRQSIGMDVVTFKLNDYKKDLAPSDEEIKAYWETHKDKYKTDRQVKLTYVLTHLDDSDEPKRPTPTPDADPAEVAKQNIEYQEKKAAWDEQRKNHTNILTGIFDDFLFEVEESEGQDFDKAAKAAQEDAGEDLKIVTTETFTADALPAELASLTIKNAQPGTSISQAIFGMKMSSELIYNIQNFGVGRDGHIAIRLDEDIQPKVKEFEAAKEDAKADLITKLATEAMTKAAEDAKSKLTEAVAAGKSFTEAATEASLTATNIAPFTTATPPADQANAADFFRIAQTTAPKTVAEDLSSSADSTSIIYVSSRTLTIEGDEALKETQLVDQAANQLKYVAFNAWILGLKDNAELKLPLAQ
ncbi:SurA N-terminal domain-containing protein [Rubritalea tangerina]|uniref:SurA N-terminal domain-containing protein n=2 Tax=Rubritalea tangerina TaxID=430798 RepID=A0ABW4Z751_9BACT